VDSRSRARARAQVSEAGGPGPARRPLSLAAAAVVQAVEAAAVFFAAVLAGVDAGRGRSYHADSGVALTVIGIVTALALGYVASGLARARPWSRTPALLTQLFTGIVSIYLIQGQRLEWGVPGLVLAVAGFVTLLVPPSLRALAGKPSERTEPPPTGQAKRRT
jgi:hypothetical protein